MGKGTNLQDSIHDELQMGCLLANGFYEVDTKLYGMLLVLREKIVP